MILRIPDSRADDVVRVLRDMGIVLTGKMNSDRSWEMMSLPPATMNTFAAPYPSCKECGKPAIAVIRGTPLCPTHALPAIEAKDNDH